MKKRLSQIKTQFAKIAFPLIAILFASPAMAQVDTTVGEGIALSDRSPVEIVVQLINWALGILAILLVVLLLYAGFLYMLSQGEAEKIEKARNIIKNALIGLVIVMSAWAITLYILSVLSDATDTSLDGGGDSACVGCSVPTGSSSFYVLSTNPEAGESDVYLCSDITVRMSEDIDTSTVTTDNWYLQVEGGSGDGAACTTNSSCSSALCQDSACVGDTVAGEIGFGPGDTTKYFNFIPDNDLPRDTTYQAVVIGGASGVVSAEGVAMSSTYQWTFDTGSETDEVPPTVQNNSSSPYPEDGAADVCTNTAINFDFSESMRISSFDDDLAYVLDYAGTTESPEAADWEDVVGFRGWTFGGDFDYAMVRPASQLEDNSLYSVRLYGGDASNNFAGSVTDSCGNPLDGDEDGVAEGANVDSYYGYDDSAGESEDPITWETGERSQCTPVVESVDPTSDYYGEFDGKHNGESCSAASECASGTCTAGVCVGYGDTSLQITGLDLAPHPEVRFEGSFIYASEDFNTCFNDDHYGNFRANTALGDMCLDDTTFSQTQIDLRTPVGSGDTPVYVTVADETSEPSSDEVNVLSPQIEWISPDNGSVGQYITISGQNFGRDQGTVTMRGFDDEGNEITSVLSLPEACGEVWATDEIVAIAPESFTYDDGSTGDWESGDIAYIQVTTTGGLYSDLEEFEFNDINRPNLCSITPSCNESAPADLTITGENFGAEQSGEDRVVFTEDGTSAYYLSVSDWEEDSIAGRTDEDMGNATYFTNVYDSDTGQSSNVRKYDIPCNDGPQVVQIANCDPDKDVFPSPNPRPNDSASCINANIGVLFDQEMDPASFSTATVSVEQYNAGDTFGEPDGLSEEELAGEHAGNTALPVDITFETKEWEVTHVASVDEESGITTYGSTYYGFKLDVQRSHDDADQDGVADGGTSDYLQPNTWYALTVNTGVTNTDGVGMDDTYTMRFKTDDTTELCDVDIVNVSPVTARMNNYWNAEGTDRESQSYTGSPYDNECRLLDASAYDWDWTLEDDTYTNEAGEEVSKDIGDFGSGDKTVSGGDSSQSVYVAGTEAENEGRADVTAAVDDISDDAEFNVEFGACVTDADCTPYCSESTCNTDTGYCTPVIESFNGQDGDHGTYVTINGCMLGAAPGTVTFSNGDVSAEAPVPEQCGETWSTDQVVIEVPTYYDSDENGEIDSASDDELPEDNYSITLTHFAADSYTATDLYTLNSEARPGVCEARPDSAGVGTEIVGTGERLTTVSDGTVTFIGEADRDGDGDGDRVEADGSITWASETGEEFRVSGAEVPTDAITDESGFLLNLDATDIDCDPGTASCTNAVEFTVECSSNAECGTGCCGASGICLASDACFACEDDSQCEAGGSCSGSQCVNGSCTPVVTGFSPEEGPNDGPVTVQGCYFGPYSAGNSVVDFGGVEADLLCGDRWTSSYIIAQVPDASSLSVGNVEVNVTRAGGIESEDTDNDTFTVISACTAEGAVEPDTGIPVLCSIYPGRGQAEAEEHFTAAEADKPNYRTGSSVSFDGDLNSFDYLGAVCTDGENDGASCTDDTDCACGDDESCIAEFGEGGNATCEERSGVLADSTQLQMFTSSVDMACDGGANDGLSCTSTLDCPRCDSADTACIDTYGADDTVDCEITEYYYTEGYLDSTDDDIDGDGEPDQVTDTESAVARVPYGGTSGIVRVEVEDDAGLYCPSNGLEFDVSCSSGDDCPAGFMCVDETCEAGSCSLSAESCSDVACGSGEGCYYGGSDAGFCCAEYPSYLFSVIEGGATDVCPNAYIFMAFDQEVEGYEDAVTLEKLTTEDDPLTAEDETEYTEFTDFTFEPVEYTTDSGATGMLLQIRLESALDVSSDYLLRIVSGEEEVDGLVATGTGLPLDNAAGELLTAFSTASNICEPDEISLLNDSTEAASYVFTSAGESTTFTTHVYASDGQELVETDDLYWDVNWSYPFLDEEEDACVDTAWIDTDATDDITESTQTVLAGDTNNASDDLIVSSVSWTDAERDTSGTTDGDLGTLTTYFCDEEAGESVWKFIDDPEETDVYTIPHLFPQNFAMFYCQNEDAGIPNLELQYVNDNVIAGNHFLEYFFQNPDNEEQAFAVRVYNNNNHFLNPEEWYDLYVPSPGAPSATTVDGYNALQDGNSYYVGATMLFDQEDDGTGAITDVDPAPLYNNIYLFSFNDAEGMDDIESMIMESVTFNWNVSKRECSASDKAQLTRDTIRKNDLHTVAEYADLYYDDGADAYPIPESSTFGSFITEMTTSKWSSWNGALGNVLGTALPTDPYNFFYAADADDPWTVAEEGNSTPWVYQGEDSAVEDLDCDNDDASVYYDQSAGNCWDTVNQQFFCPAYSHVYMYHVDQDDTDIAYLYGNMEYDGDEAFVTSASYTSDHALFDACDRVDTPLSAACECFNYGLTTDTALRGTPGEVVDEDDSTQQANWAEINF